MESHLRNFKPCESILEKLNEHPMFCEAHLCMSSEKNGYATDDTPRDEGWQAEEGQECLQREARAAAGGTLGETRNRIVSIENSAKEIKPFIVHNVKTVEEVIRKIYDRFPGMESDALYLRVCDSRMGTLRRRSLKGDLPEDAFHLYVSLHLKKHPGLLSQ